MENPWMGLASYSDPEQNKQKYLFCGRNNAIAKLNSIIISNVVVTLYGRSGIGKTSLLNAGVFPALRKRSYFPVSLRLSKLDDADGGLAEAVVRFLENELKAANIKVETEREFSAIKFLNEEGNVNTNCLVEYFYTRTFKDPDGNEVFPVFAFDQFEELFRMPGTDDFLQQINALAIERFDAPKGYNEYINYRLVLSIREDELYLLEDSITKLNLYELKGTRLRLEQLTDEEAKEIIEIPGANVLPTDEKDRENVITKIIRAAKDEKKENLNTLMLSLICSELFKKAATENAEKPQITVAMIEQLGQNILRDFYLGIVADLPDSDHIFLEENLVDANRMRNSVNVGIMDTGCPALHNLKEGTSRILQDTNGKVELVHDQLALAVFESREKRKEEERIKEIRRKTRRKMIVMSSVATLAIIIIGFMVWQVKKAYDANWKMMENQAKAVAGKAMDLINDGDSYTAALLALEVLPKHLYDQERPYTAEAESALRFASQNESAILLGHKGEIYSVRFNPDGTRIVSASSDKTIKVWDAESGIQVIPAIKGHTGSVNYACFSPDGKQIVSASSDCTVRVWNTTDGTLQGLPMKGHKQRVNSVSCSPDGALIASASSDNTVRIWNAKTTMPVGKPLNLHSGIVTSVCFSPDGKTLASCSRDKTIRLWDVKNGFMCLKVLKGHYANVSSVAFSPDSKKLVSASWDNTVRLWNVETGKQIGKPLVGHTGDVCDATFCCNGRFVLSAAADRTIRVWDVSTGMQLGEPIIKHGSYVISVDFSDSKNRIVSSSRDRTVRIYGDEDIAFYRMPFLGHVSAIRRSSCSNNNRYIVSAFEDNTIWIWDNVKKTERKVLQYDASGKVNSVVLSPNEDLLVTASWDRTIRIWNVKDGKPFGSPFVGHSNGVRYAEFSSDGKRIVSASSDKTIRIWDVKTGKLLGKPLRGHSADVRHASFSWDGKRIVSTSSDQTVRIWDVDKGCQIGPSLKGHKGDVICASFSPDGSKVVSASWDCTICIWDAKTGKQLGLPIKTASKNIYSIWFGGDGKSVEYLDSNSIVRVITLKPLQQLIDDTRARFKNRQLTLEERRKYYLE